MTDRELMEAAITGLIADNHNGVTGAYIGADGAGAFVIVCQVGKKLPGDAMYSQNVKPVPKRVAIEGYTTRQFNTRVEEAPSLYYPMLLRVAPGQTLEELVAFSPFAGAQNLQSCQTPTMPGGSQIAPRNAGWVGTDGAAVQLSDADSFGFLTNWHVANGGQFGQDAPQCQPHGSSEVFGYQRRWVNIGTNNEDNLVDCSYIEDKRWKDSGGEFIYGEPTQYQFGKLDPNYYKESELKIGLEVQKSGRTTGYTRGKITGLGGTFHVGYDHGTGKFVRQVQIRSDSGLFSSAGDSGSLICDMQGRPVCLLFAGGGNDTIASPIDFVVSELKIKFWQR